MLFINFVESFTVGACFVKTAAAIVKRFSASAAIVTSAVFFKRFSVGEALFE